MCCLEENDAILRVQRMEQCFDALMADWQADPPKVDEERLKLLLGYYEGGQWLLDYELDERGGFPPHLKRGVLSEDGVYNFLTEVFGTADPVGENGVCLQEQGAADGGLAENEG